MDYRGFWFSEALSIGAEQAVQNRKSMKSKRTEFSHKLGAEQDNFIPTRMVEVELSEPIAPLEQLDSPNGVAYSRANILVRLHSHPLGLVSVSIPAGGLSAHHLATAIWGEFHDAIRNHLHYDQLPIPSALPVSGIDSVPNSPCLAARKALLSSAPFVSIVVPTRDRTASLAVAIDSLLALEYPNFELIIVDNAPSTDATAKMVQEKYERFPHVRYLREERPGVDWARNRGLVEARGEIFACTDDDVRVDRHWLSALVECFRLSEHVACVTGLALPAELSSPIQGWFESYGGFSRGFDRTWYDLKHHRPNRPLYPYIPGIFGASVNMAIRTEVLRKCRGFDPALGAGSPAMGGGDIALFFQIIMSGYTLIYEPAAIVHHYHRNSFSALHKQVYSYGVGYTAFLTKCMLENPRSLLGLIPQVPYAAAGLVFKRRAIQSEANYPLELTKAEFRGMFYGPLAYLRGRRQARRMRERFGPLHPASTPQLRNEDTGPHSHQVPAQEPMIKDG